ncbi:TPA: hypothetical protein ACGUU0_003367 [Vibrio vulnificus]|nr:hypothetical protein [Vibrio vulnificus]
MPFAIPFLIGAGGIGLGFGAYTATQKAVSWLVIAACVFLAFKFVF